MRKVLSFVLVLSLVLGSFSMAFAATPAATATGLSDIKGIANEEAIQVSYDLGIVTGNPDGTFLPTKAVTRAEFAAMVTRALSVPDSALAGYKTTNFKDTNGYAWAVPYLAFCQSKGIMLGDGAGNVMPGRTINTNEAITMVLRAVGYTSNSAELVGAWPSNYVTKAQDLKIYEDVAATGNVDKANAAQILYNALSVKKVAVNSDGKTTVLDQVKIDGKFYDPSMLTTGLNCTYNDELVAYSDTSLISVTKYVGAQATVYKNKDGKIIAVKPISTFLKGKIKASDRTIFKSGGVEYTLKPADTTTFTAIVNTKATTTAVSLGGLAADPTSYTLAVKVSGKTITDIYSATTWTVTNSKKVEAADLIPLKDKKLLGKEFYKNNDGNIDYDTFELVGVKSLDDIKADNIVYVYTQAGSNKIIKVAVGTEVVTGVVTGVNKDGDFTINSKLYSNSQTTAVADDDVKDTHVTKELKVWLDGYGEGYTFEVTKGSANKYAVVSGANVPYGHDTIVKLFTPDGSNKSYTFDTDDVTNMNTSVGYLVGYNLNKDGQIDDFDRATSAGVGATEASMKIMTGTAVNTLKLSNSRALTYTISGSGVQTAVIASDVVVYTYAKGTIDTASDFKVSSIDKIKTSDDVTATSGASIFFDKDGKVVAMLVASTSASKSDTDLYAVINGSTVTADGSDKVYTLDGFANGAALSKKTDGKNVEIANGSSYQNFIQLYKLGTDANGVINSITLVGPKYNVAPTAGAFTLTNGIVVAESGTGYIKATNAAFTLAGESFIPNAAIAIAKDAKFYEVTLDGAKIDNYATAGSSIQKGSMVWVFDTNDDVDGYDVVIVKAPN